VVSACHPLGAARQLWGKHIAHGVRQAT